MRSLPGFAFYGAPNLLNVFCWIGNRRANVKECCDDVAAGPRQLFKTAAIPLPNVPAKH
jgi:hypothetical protein